MCKYILIFLLCFGVNMKVFSQIKSFEITGVVTPYLNPFYDLQNNLFSLGIRNFEKNETVEGYFPVNYTFEQNNVTISTSYLTYNSTNFNQTTSVPVNFNFTIPDMYIDQISTTGLATFEVVNGDLIKFGVSDWATNDGDYMGTVSFRVSFENDMNFGVSDPTPKTYTVDLHGKANPSLTTTIHWSKAVLFDPNGAVSYVTTQKKVGSGSWVNISSSTSQIVSQSSVSSVQYKVVYSLSSGFGSGNVKGGSTSGASNYAYQSTLASGGQIKTMIILVNTSGKELFSLQVVLLEAYFKKIKNLTYVIQNTISGFFTSSYHRIFTSANT